MSEGQSKVYKVDPGHGVKEQIATIKTACKNASERAQFIGIMEEAEHRLRTDPNGWGEPEYRSKFVDAVMCHGLIRPVAFQFVIFEQVRAVVLTQVRLYANFD